MAVYEHKCDACNHEFELEYSIKADPPKVCPQCGKEEVRRMISSGMSRMELSPTEFIERLPEDKRKLMKEIGGNESRFANLVGESSYNDYSKKPAYSERRRR